MRQIQECFNETAPIVDFIKSRQDGVNENLKDVINNVKTKLGNIVKKVIEYAKGLVARIQDWYMVIDEEGNLKPCSTPLTMGNAWVSGYIDKSSTFVGMGKKAGQLTSSYESFSNATKMYPSTLELWKSLSRTCEGNEEEFIKSLMERNSEEVNDMLNEVKLGNEDPEAQFNVIVDNKKLKDTIKRHVTRPLARLMVWGAPGIGKTAILNTVIDEIQSEQGKDYNLIVKTLSNETPDNFMLPKYTEDGRADDVPKTWIPVWRPTGDKKVDAELDAKCGRGLLFLDELSRATPQVQNVILPLVNEGIFNGWQLGSGWSIVCASNRDEDELSGQTQIGSALSNRFAHVYYEPCVNTWREWADKQGFMSPLLTQWLAMPNSETYSGGKFYYFDPNEDGDSVNPTKLMCSPRSWTNAMKDLAEYHHTGTLEGFNLFDLDEFDIKFVLNKYVPAAAVTKFWGFLQVIRSIGNFDEAVHNVWKNGGKGLKLSAKDLINVSMPLAQLIICAHKESLPTAEEFNSLATWVASANNEQLACYVIDIFKNVFAANVPSELYTVKDKKGKNADAKTYIFFLKKMYDKNPELWSKIQDYDAFMKSWGINYDTMPDYSEGMSIIAKKYQAAFASVNIDGADGLG